MMWHVYTDQVEIVAFITCVSTALDGTYKSVMWICQALGLRWLGGGRGRGDNQVGMAVAAILRVGGC